MTTLVKTAVGVGAAATVGTLAATPRSDWYQSLDKPRWQPPPAAFPIVWTSLYVLIAVAGARALDRLHATDRHQFRRVYAANLALNAAWTAIFFRARQPKLALLEIVTLDAANVALLRRAWRADRTAALALLPYVAWTGFATVLNGAIASRNPGQAAASGLVADLLGLRVASLWSEHGCRGRGFRRRGSASRPLRCHQHQHRCHAWR